MAIFIPIQLYSDMNLSELYFDLPKDRIAVRPLKDRDASRLLVVKRDKGLQHAHFRDLPNFLNRGDLIILNDTKVVPVRLRIKKPTGGIIDAIVTNRIDEKSCEVMFRGDYCGQGYLEGEVVSISCQKGRKTMRFQSDLTDIIDKHGLMPLPPYIKRIPDDEDKKSYQTVYAENEGSIAAPTAGLHFTEDLLARLQEKGIDIERITLHVGKGTFLPIKTNDVKLHKMQEEWFEIKRILLDKIMDKKKQGNKVIAVGTTTTRALEGILSNQYKALNSNNGVIRGMTDIFIYPPYDFKAIDGLITNFHLPSSTPLLLVASLLGIDKTKEIYKIAIEKDYRFFSYGDAMLIL
ncbi:MAG: tRNA preQ1(34) S-adenosylmethionine ribosyltransferase-isomerase QueA [Thermodesulfovibrionales bacterium]|nr:tRNA preQ1(34) S-adenosylmethionine ribosyltransferase-isomerase QueA [Thermodesulfovibrionales bacterium]